MYCTINGRVIGRGRPATVMGVVNVSPESFFTGSYVPEKEIRSTAEGMMKDGAMVVDVGARSTAPNAPMLSQATELERIDRALDALDGSGITISVDTKDPIVLSRCLRHDIHAVNDISGLSSPGFAALVADAGLPAILMASHRRPGDATGLGDTVSALAAVVQRCVDAGIHEYVLDPGIGLWVPQRTVAQDWELCQAFEEFRVFERPLLAAVSRKSFIGYLVGAPPEKRLAASIALTVLLRQRGADMIRTHDVRETVDAMAVVQCMDGD